MENILWSFCILFAELFFKIYAMAADFKRLFFAAATASNFFA